MKAEDVLGLQRQQARKLRECAAALEKEKESSSRMQWQRLLTQLQISFWISEVALQLAMLNEKKSVPFGMSLWERLFGHKANDG